MMHRMPTSNPRITVTLTPEVHAILKRMSELTGNSQSAIVGDLLLSSREVFARVVTVLEAAEVAKGTVNREIKEGLDRAQAKLEQQLGLALETMDDALQPLREPPKKASGTKKAGGVGARSGRASPAQKAASTPVPVTRGSGHPRGPEKGAERQAAAPGRKGTGKGVSRG